MPTSELEQHPFLNYFKAQLYDWNQYRKMIVGTFPIYSITASQPQEAEGLRVKAQWSKEAHFPFFYGSRNNQFWSLLSQALEQPRPNSRQECTDMLNQGDILITDAIATACRAGYSALDEDLIPHQLNNGIVEILQYATHLEAIYFTSQEAKQLFCEITAIPYQPTVVEQWNGQNGSIQLVCLPSPSRSGAQSLPRNAQFLRWLFNSHHHQITPESWADFNSYRGKGKLDYFIQQHGLPRGIRLTNLYRSHFYRLAFSAEWEALNNIVNVEHPQYT